MTTATASIGLADSPVRGARLLLHKTIAEAAEEAKVNWQLWYLVEAGCYENIPTAINDFFVRRGLEKVSHESYKSFREGKQKEFGIVNHLTFHSLPPVNVHHSPIKSLWEAIGISRSLFAKSLAIQPAHLYRLERGQAREIPETVQTAFAMAGVPVDIIEELNERQIEFYESVS